MNLKKIALFTLTILLLLATELAGQGMSARVTGTVRDEDGKPLAGVLVTAVNTINNATLTATSVEPDGSFRLLGLAPAIYQVSFDLQGYESYTAAGISLSVEQSVTLRIKLKRGSTGSAPAEATPAAAKVRFFDQRGKFSLQVGVGMSRLHVGDSNDYLDAFSQRFDTVQQPFRLLRGGIEVNGQVGYRVTPRLEIAAGAGLVSGGTWNNELASEPSAAALIDRYLVCMDMRTIPLSLGCRYWLNTRSHVLFSVSAAVEYHFARWAMDTEYSHERAMGQVLPQNITYESASGHGLGWAAGGRAEVKMDAHYSLVAELSGRWAPVRNFSGRRIFFPSTVMSKPQITDGELWSFESYDAKRSRWISRLEVGGPPAGEAVRNISRATVDFSGLSLRIGLLFHL